MKRVAVIGLDGVPWNVLNRLFEYGSMPHLKRITKDAARGVLESTVPPVSPQAWTSIATGVNPGKHGIFDFVTFDQEFRSHVATSRQVMYPRLHEMLALHDKRSVVVNLLFTYPIRPVRNVITICDWLAPKLMYYPAAIKRLIEGYPIPEFYWHPRETDEQLYQEAYQETLNRTKTLRNLVYNVNWDLFFTVFIEPDWIMHRAYGEILKDKNCRAIKVFSLLDEFINDVASRADLLLVISDHGFSSYDKVIHVNTLFCNAKLAKTKLTITESVKDVGHFMMEDHGGKYAPKRPRVPKLVYRISKKIPIRRFRSWMVRKSLWRPRIDIHRSNAFTLTHASHGVYVKRGLSADLAVKFLREAHESNGEPFFSLVEKRENLYDGPFVRRASHIIFLPNFDAGFNFTTSIGDDILSKKTTYDHHPEGIIIASGNMVKPTTFRANAVDVTPSILAYMGLPVPQNTDGKVLNVFEKPLKVKYADYFYKWKLSRGISYLKERKFI